MALAARRNIAGACATLVVVLSVCAPPQLAARETLQVQADAAAQQLLRRAEDLLARGEHSNAWRLLRPREAELAGNPYYDYLLGIAALDSGLTSEAIFSLRRALAVEPRFSGARMELARAYFEAGNTGQARPLFVGLLDENPPPGVRDVLNRYIAAIDARQRTPGPRFLPYLELFAGHDSNANGSTDNQQFLGFTLSTDNLATDSPFIEGAAGFDWYVPRSTQLAWLLGARVGYRANPDASFVDADILNGYAAMNWQRGSFFGRAGLEAYSASRDGNSNEALGGVDVLLGRRLGERWDVTLNLRGGALRYDESIEVLDVNRFLYTLGASYRFSVLSRLRFEVIGGSDDEQQTGSPYGNSKAGGRVSLTAGLGRSSILSASIGSLTTDYDGPFFGVPREDTQLTTMLQIEFRDVLTDGLSLIPRARYVDNDSDVELYDYDRTELGLLIRWTPR